MPPKQPRTLLSWIILAGLVMGLITWIYFQPFILIFILALIIIGVAENRVKRRRLLRITKSRQDSICDLARSFPRRDIDPWIIRAVFDELVSYLPSIDRPFPLRAEDRFKEDLKIDEEDLDEMACAIATRAKYSMEACDKNPLYGKVKTVRDLVLFYTHQERLIRQ